VVRRDELGGGTHGELPLSVWRSKQEQRDAGPTHDAGTCVCKATGYAQTGGEPVMREQKKV
jgi:hypothetical protein